MKYNPAPPPSKPEHIIEFLSRELRRIGSHTHDDPFWQSVRAGASAITPPGAATDPQWDATKGGWLFDATTAEELHLMVQLPQDWQEGSNLVPHVRWEKTTSATGNVAWQISYQWLGTGAARTSEATLSAADVLTYTAVADFHMVTAFGELTASAGTAISDVLFVRLERDPAATSDTYAADARLVSFDLHYKADTPGALYPYRKR